MTTEGAPGLQLHGNFTWLRLQGERVTAMLSSEAGEAGTGHGVGAPLSLFAFADLARAAQVIGDTCKMVEVMNGEKMLRGEPERVRRRRRMRALITR
jgi:hypothetical protein